MNEASTIVPPCLRCIPVAARSQAALLATATLDRDVFGDGFALLVTPQTRPSPNEHCGFWQKYSLGTLHPEQQLWVHRDLQRYREAWTQCFGDPGSRHRVVDHIYNRKRAADVGFVFLRVALINRGVNTDSGRGMETTQREHDKYREAHGVAYPEGNVEHAGPDQWTKMLNIKIGGGGKRHAPMGMMGVWQSLRSLFTPECVASNECCAATAEGPVKKKAPQNSQGVEFDYKNTEILRRFLSPDGKLLPRRRTRLSSKNQRKLTSAVKRARAVGLLPFADADS